MFTEITGAWEELVTRPEFQGHQVKVTIIDQPPMAAESDDWLVSLRRMAKNGVRIMHPADDSRESIYEAPE
jgi:hypothetical protein